MVGWLGCVGHLGWTLSWWVGGPLRSLALRYLRKFHPRTHAPARREFLSCVSLYVTSTLATVGPDVKILPRSSASRITSYLDFLVFYFLERLRVRPHFVVHVTQWANELGA